MAESLDSVSGEYWIKEISGYAEESLMRENVYEDPTMLKRAKGKKMGINERGANILLVCIKLQDVQI